MTRDEMRETARVLLMEFRSPKSADLRRLLEAVAWEEPERESADRARAAEIGLHGELRPVPCSTTVMLAIPDWLRPHLYVGAFDASHPEYGYDAEGRE